MKMHIGISQRTFCTSYKVMKAIEIVYTIQIIFTEQYMEQRISISTAWVSDNVVILLFSICSKNKKQQRKQKWK